MEDVLMDWLLSVAEKAPEIAILGYVAYELRRNLLDCIAHNQELLDVLIKRVLDAE